MYAYTSYLTDYQILARIKTQLLAKFTTRLVQCIKSGGISAHGLRRSDEGQLLPPARLGSPHCSLVKLMGLTLVEEKEEL